jgi:Tol biopolymer transport system component
MSNPITRLSAALSGRYSIVRRLGEGGMATVYLADDLRHDRKVALKVLKPELAAVVGAERFLAEIKTTANLQHPHILPLFDSGEADGFLFYVMPYVEGESLGEKLRREKQLPVDEAVRIATDVGEALDHAHRKGVIHRDVKPANVLLRDGRPLVADFGIALAISAAGGGRLTETGLSLGTPYYMSPEQAAADRDSDARSDVYSLGCVLYEMLVGDPPHTASSAQAVLAKVLTEEAPAPASARASIPANVDAAIRRALEKLPADRFKTAREFAAALGDSAFTHGIGGSAAAARGAGPWTPVTVASAATAGTLAIAFLWMLLRPTPPPGPVVRSVIPLNGADQIALADMAPARAERPSLALSRSGEHLAYVVSRDGVSHLALRRLSAFEEEALPGTEGAFHPFFSPDGEWIGFFTPTELKKISIRGGAPQTLTAATYATGAVWGDNDSILFSDGEGGRLSWVSTGGGEPHTWLEQDGDRLWWPELLPGGNGVLVTDVPASRSPSILVVDRETRARRTLAQGSGARYVGSGHLVYAAEGGVLAAPFDLSAAEITGTAVPVLDSVRRGAYGAVPQLAISANGVVAYVHGPDMGLTTPVWVDRDGNEEPVPVSPGRYGAFDLSPDGRRLAINHRTTAGGLALYDFTSGGDLRPLTTYAGLITQPTWAGNNRVVFSSLEYDADGGEISTLIAQPIDGSPASPITRDPLAGESFTESWSADGTLAFDVETPAGEDIWILEPESPARPFIDSPASEWAGDFSPDGRWLAYMSDETGQNEVWVTDYPGGQSRLMLSTNVGEGKEPIWSPLGDEVFFRSGGRLMRVPVSTGPELQPGTPEVLFEGPYTTVGGPEFDVAPDAQRFLLLREPDAPPATEIRLVTNWFEELRERVPNR